MPNTVARERARTQQMTPRPMGEYARDLGQKAAAMFPPGMEITEDHKALVILLHAGLSPALVAACAARFPEGLGPIADLAAELVTVP